MSDDEITVEVSQSALELVLQSAAKDIEALHPELDSEALEEYENAIESVRSAIEDAQ